MLDSPGFFSFVFSLAKSSVSSSVCSVWARLPLLSEQVCLEQAHPFQYFSVQCLSLGWMLLLHCYRLLLLLRRHWLLFLHCYPARSSWVFSLVLFFFVFLQVGLFLDALVDFFSFCSSSSSSASGFALVSASAIFAAVSVAFSKVCGRSWLGMSKGASVRFFFLTCSSRASVGLLCCLLPPFPLPRPLPRPLPLPLRRLFCPSESDPESLWSLSGSSMSASASKAVSRIDFRRRAWACNQVMRWCKLCIYWCFSKWYVFKIKSFGCNAWGSKNTHRMKQTHRVEILHEIKAGPSTNFRLHLFLPLLQSKICKLPRSEPAAIDLGWGLQEVHKLVVGPVCLGDVGMPAYKCCDWLMKNQTWCETFSYWSW